jgi:hypothetical protein
MEHRDIDYQYILDFYFIFVGIKDAVFLFTLTPRHSTLEQQQHQHSYRQVSVDG